MRDVHFEVYCIVKYQGVLVGLTSVTMAFTAPLAEAYLSPKLASSLNLSYAEKSTVLKTWILLGLLLPARAYAPRKSTEVVLQ